MCHSSAKTALLLHRAAANGEGEPLRSLEYSTLAPTHDPAGTPAQRAVPQDEDQDWSAGAMVRFTIKFSAAEHACVLMQAQLRGRSLHAHLRHLIFRIGVPISERTEAFELAQISAAASAAEPPAVLQR